jgi:hypothetical protein
VGKFLQDKKDENKMAAYLMETAKMNASNVKSAVLCIKTYVDSFM